MFSVLDDLELKAYIYSVSLHTLSNNYYYIFVKTLNNALYNLVPCSKVILCDYYRTENKQMNRRKKGNQILKARLKKANAKLSSKNKPKYISKADREAQDTASTEDTSVVAQK